MTRRRRGSVVCARVDGAFFFGSYDRKRSPLEYRLAAFGNAVRREEIAELGRTTHARDSWRRPSGGDVFASWRRVVVSQRDPCESLSRRTKTWCCRIVCGWVNDRTFRG